MSDVIRDARVEDAGAMLEIYGPIIRDTAISFEFTVPTVDEFAGRLTKADPWLVMETDGRVAGYAYAGEFRARAAYSASRETSVYVHPDHHGRGVGRRLMEVVLDRMVERGDHRAVAGVTLPNAGSVALHEALGFVHVGTFTESGRKFDAWHDVGFWELDLTTWRPSTP